MLSDFSTSAVTPIEKVMFFEVIFNPTMPSDTEQISMCEQQHEERGGRVVNSFIITAGVQISHH